MSGLRYFLKLKKENKRKERKKRERRKELLRETLVFDTACCLNTVSKLKGKRDKKKKTVS